jgi:hypothetical protein
VALPNPPVIAHIATIRPLWTVEKCTPSQASSRPVAGTGRHVPAHHVERMLHPLDGSIPQTLTFLEHYADAPVP